MIDIYVINLPERIDRKKRLIKNYKKYTDINLIFVEAIKNNNGHVGCFLSHQKCLEIAKEKKMDHIIVLEDDTIPKPQFNFSSELKNVLAYLKNKKDWNIFLGLVRYLSSTPITQKIIRKTINYKNGKYVYINKGFSTTLVIYNKSSYDFFLNTNPLSGAIDYIWHNKIVAVTKIPYFIKCTEVYSNVAKKTDMKIKNLIIAKEKYLLL